MRFKNVEPKSFLWISVGYAEPFLIAPLYNASHNVTSRITLALSVGLTKFSFSTYLIHRRKQNYMNVNKMDTLHFTNIGLAIYHKRISHFVQQSSYRERDKPEDYI